ncbi:MAG: hypothetical protein PHD31_02010 [Candidatus Pacebacteria bacterium]|nr:hypothetical protein [Candidatus Paceibacterota bacterium]
MTKLRIESTDPRFLNFDFKGFDGVDYNVLFSELDKRFLLSVIINNEKQDFLSGTSFTLVFSKRLFVLHEYSREVVRIAISKLYILTDWEWSMHIKESGRSPGNITIHIDDALKSKFKKLTP